MGGADDAGEGGRGRDEPAEGSYEDQEPERALTFMQHDFGLDRRLMKAVAKIGFVYPTLVQNKCIPLALKGKDLLVSSNFVFFIPSRPWMVRPHYHSVSGSPVYAPPHICCCFFVPERSSWCVYILDPVRTEHLYPAGAQGGRTCW